MFDCSDLFSPSITKLMRLSKHSNFMICIFACWVMYGTGCASSMSAPSQSPRKPTSIDDAEKQLSDAESQIKSLVSQPAGTSIPGDDQRPPPPPSKDGMTPTPNSETNHSCPQACKAFSSMKRAVETICQMAGETTERCLQAKERLKASEGMIAICKCSHQE
jgi:hypothetical protein